MKPLTDKDFNKHPCFNPDAKGQYGRIHLPVAPKCNIKCNFCDRKYDCVNESRPGVTSSLLSPEQAAKYVKKALEIEPRLSVVGIAGPGDPFANPLETLRTLRLIKKNHPEMLLCVSSNGLGITPHIEALAEIEVSHVTITVCSVDPTIGKHIYSWVRDGNIVYRGEQGAKLLQQRQIEAIKKLQEHGIIVKVNFIVIPGINDHHAEEVASTMKELGVDLLNCMAMFPNVNTPFGHLSQPDKASMKKIRDMSEGYLPQMRHCTRCRADAVGLLGEETREEFQSCLSASAALPKTASEERPYVAVASHEGLLINQHLGEAKNFQIWEQDEGQFHAVEKRLAPKTGGGIKRWHQLAALLADCRAVLVSGVGETPREILSKAGIMPVEASGFIEEGLRTIYEGRATGVLKGRRSPCSDGSCTGTGGGCG